MTEVRFLPPAAKFLKKIKDKKLKSLYQAAVDKIREDHSVGELKTGDLSGIYGYDIFSGLANVNSQNSVVTTNSIYNNESLSLTYLMQHELSHNIGAADDICTPGEARVIHNEDGFGEWCTKHRLQIKASYP